VSGNPFIANPAWNSDQPGMSYPYSMSAPVMSESVVERLLAQAAKQEREGQPWQAINTYRQALRLEPHNETALISYARMKHRAGDFDGAIILYGQVLKNQPFNAIALNDVGLCLARKGNLGQAAASLQKAVEQRPENPRYRNNLAIVLVESGREREALEHLQVAHGPAIAHYNLATLLSRSGKNQAAAMHLQQAIQLDPAFQPAMELLASLQGEQPRERVAASQPLPSGDRIVERLPSAPQDPMSGREEPILIEPQSGEMNDGQSDVVRSADWRVEEANEPPNVDDYHIPGISQFE
jgi:Flp pilus assembly protein TadD